MANFTLITHPMSRGQIARWALHEVAADYDQVLVDWTNKPNLLTSSNPMGKVPTLIHHTPAGDKVVTECAGICAFLAAAMPEGGLLPTADEQADYYRWLFFAAGPVEQAVVTRSMGWEVPPEREGMVGWGNFERTIGALDDHFQHSDFVCGARFTMADVYVGSQVDWGLAFGSIPASPALNAYAERIRQRPAYQAAKAIDMALIAAAQAG